MHKQSSIILIGMPGCGKSTLGPLLAKELSRDFIDIDTLIQRQEGKTLQQIVNDSGYLSLRHVEAQVMIAAEFPNHVISTGGSAVYSVAGMKNLLKFGPAVFLHCTLQELQRRIHNYENRGIARAPKQSFAELFAEREALYRHYASSVIECDNKDIWQLLQEVKKSICP